MRKIWVILILLALLSSVKVQAMDLGIGYTFDTGIHARIGNLEAQSVFGSPSIYGLRWYGLNKSIKTKGRSLGFYGGTEADLIISGDENGIIAGVFTGLEKALVSRLHLSLDLGIFGSWVYHSGDVGLALNTKLTYYFKKGR